MPRSEPLIREGAVSTSERSQDGVGAGTEPRPEPSSGRNAVVDARAPLPAARESGQPFAPGGLPAVEDLEAPRASETMEFDSIEEVDAVARSLRRVAIEYAVAIVAILLAVPLLSLTAEWWFARPVFGGLTLNFMTVAVGLNLAFVTVAVLYTRVAHRSEDEMLGRLESGDERDDV